ncbi:MKI67 FHA domain-interacting nucleolar phosphoprotein, partial [Galemys pyrenaicus]
SLNPQQEAGFQKEVAQAWSVTGQRKPYSRNSSEGVSHTTLAVQSKRTGNSRGQAFVEWESEDVAKIVSKIMDSYLCEGKMNDGDKDNEIISSQPTSGIKEGTPTCPRRKRQKAASDSEC